MRLSKPLRREKKISRTIRTIVVLVGTVVLVGYFVLFYSSFFSIQEVGIEGVSNLESPQVYNSVLQSIRGKKMLTTSKNELARLINLIAPNFKVVDINYTFPNKVSIDVLKRRPEFLVRARNGKFNLDESGFVLGVFNTLASNKNDEVDVVYDKELKVGQLIEDSMLKAALAYSRLNQQVSVQGGEISISLKNGGKVILPKKAVVKEVQRLTEILQKIMQKYTIEGREIDFIDLRFSKPVIKYR